MSRLVVPVLLAMIGLYLYLVQVGWRLRAAEIVREREQRRQHAAEYLVRQGLADDLDDALAQVDAEAAR